jgi:hypothetical protein
MIHTSVQEYIDKQETSDKQICEFLAHIIDEELSASENKVWHAHPVWFLNQNPIVGFSKQKTGWRLMFWSGADFDENELNSKGGKFKDASVFIHSIEEINQEKLKSWLRKSREIQWDYKNVVKRKGRLEKIETLLPE